jgi:hypothetical protein
VGGGAGFGIALKDSGDNTVDYITTAADGSYNFVVGSAGSYTVTAAPIPGYVLNLPATVSGTAMIGSTTTMPDIIATPGSIRGIVVDSATGNPIYNAVVQAGPPGLAGPAVVTDENGAYSLPALGTGGSEVYADAVGYAGRRLLVTATGGVMKDIALTAEVEVNSYNGNMEDLVGNQPTQWGGTWDLSWWGGAPGVIDWMASTNARHGLQSLFFTPNGLTPNEWSGVFKTIPLALGYCYNWYFRVTADTNVVSWQPLVTFGDENGRNGRYENEFVSADPSYYDWAHTPPQMPTWHTYLEWGDFYGANTHPSGPAVRWTPLPGETQCTFVFIYNWQDVIPPAGSGIYIDDLVLDAVPTNMVVQSVSADAPPALPAPVIVSGEPTFSVSNTVSGWQYTLVYKNHLTDAAWIPLTGPGSLPGNGSTISLVDTNTPLAGSRFYRLAIQ